MNEKSKLNPSGQKRWVLLPFAKRIIELRSAGYSYRQIVDFLEIDGCKTSVSTVQRFIKKYTTE